MRWMLLILVTVAVTVPLDLLGVPSAALFAALLVGVALAITRLAPAAVPRPAGLAAQGVLGVYIGTMVHGDALEALGPHWPVVLGVGIATLLLSIARRCPAGAAPRRQRPHRRAGPGRRRGKKKAATSVSFFMAKYIFVVSGGANGDREKAARRAAGGVSILWEISQILDSSLDLRTVVEPVWRSSPGPWA